MFRPHTKTLVTCYFQYKGASKNCFCFENVRNFLRLWRKVKIAAGIAKSASRTKFGLTTPQVEIAAVRSKNEFLEVPIRTAD